ncbi:PRI1 primase, partial [Urocolius indicus]|nr:PRI1 primase [Urocolius indicus]
EDLGMRHRLWVYSGRRGVHCWVCDDAVRKWSPALRAAAVEYLSLVKVGSEGTGISLCLCWVQREGQCFWGGGRKGVCWCLATSLDRWAQHREVLQAEFPKKRDSAQRWELLRSRMERTRRGKSLPCYADWEVMLQYCFPRLDINVSKGVGHLLKSPFSVHPKTGLSLVGLWPREDPGDKPCGHSSLSRLSGRISVPLDLQRLEQFDPFAVPTISSLCQELDAAGGDGEREDGGETEPKRRVRDYKKTSLAPYVRVFEQFVEEMERARRGERLRRSGKSQAG